MEWKVEDIEIGKERNKEYEVDNMR